MAISIILSGCNAFLEVKNNGQQSTTGTTTETSSTQSTTQSSTQDQSTEPQPACALTPSQASFGAWIDKRCEKMIQCCDAAELTSFLGTNNPSASSCKSTLTDALMAQESSPERAEIMASFDASFAAAMYLISTKHTEVRAGCLDSCIIAQGAKDCSKRSKERCESKDDYPGGPCDPNLLFHGTRSENQTCDPALVNAGLDVECRYGLDCMPQNDGSHRCVPVPAIGESCSVKANDRRGNCEYDAVCDPKSKTCVKGAAVGAACNHQDTANFVGCLPGLMCGQDNRCVPECQAGARCVNESGQSDDRLCPDNFFCHPGTTPYCTVANPEQTSCDSDGDCPSNKYCSSALDGSPIGTSTVGTCTAKQSEGACTRHEECAKAFVCLDSQCQAKSGASAKCSSSAECSQDAPLCAHVDRDGEGNFQVLSSVCSDGQRDTRGCKVKDPGLLDAPSMQNLLRPEWIRLQSPDAPWVSICPNGGCEQDQDGKGRCTPYAQKDQPCDYLVSDALPSCAPGLACVAGVCTTFLTVDAQCDPASETWKSTDPAHTKGFPTSVCDPTNTRCVSTGQAQGRCQIDPLRISAAICDGE